MRAISFAIAIVACAMVSATECATSAMAFTQGIRSETPSAGRRPGPSVAQAQAQPQPQAQPAPPPSPPIRTEILRFENWSVTCNEFAEANRKRSCVAQLQVQSSNANQIVMTWAIAINDNKQFVMAMQTPTGVVLAPGVKLKLEKGPDRSVAYESCDTNQCIAKQVVDNNLLADINSSSTAQVTLQAINGNQVNLSFSVKGAEKALAHLRSKL
jgi:invasion protein IalB